MKEPIRPNKIFEFSCDKSFKHENHQAPSMMMVMNFYKEFLEYARTEYAKFATDHNCSSDDVFMINEDSIVVNHSYRYLVEYYVSIDVKNLSYDSEYKAYTEALVNYKQFLIEQEKIKQQFIDRDNEIKRLKKESHRIRLEKRIEEISSNDNLSDSLKIKIIKRYCNIK